MLAFEHTWWRLGLASGTQSWPADGWESHHRVGSGDTAVLEPWPDAMEIKFYVQVQLRPPNQMWAARSFNILHPFPFQYFKMGDDPFSFKRRGKWVFLERPLCTRFTLGVLHELFHLILTTARSS